MEIVASGPVKIVSSIVVLGVIFERSPRQATTNL